jgi:hypothetical protein
VLYRGEPLDRKAGKAMSPIEKDDDQEPLDDFERAGLAADRDRDKEQDNADDASPSLPVIGTQRDDD